MNHILKSSINLFYIFIFINCNTQFQNVDKYYNQCIKNEKIFEDLYNQITLDSNYKNVTITTDSNMVYKNSILPLDPNFIKKMKKTNIFEISCSMDVISFRIKNFENNPSQNVWLIYNNSEIKDTFCNKYLIKKIDNKKYLLIEKY